MLSLYIKNYKCLEKFFLISDNGHSLMLAGKNGAGKSAILDVFGIFQFIGKGESKIANLIFPENFTAWATDNIMELRILTSIQGKIYNYTLEIEILQNFLSYRIKNEILYLGEDVLFSRSNTTIHVLNQQIDIDYYTLALPMIPLSDQFNPIGIFKNWLAQMFLLRPIPSEMSDSNMPMYNNYNYLNLNCDNFAGIIMNYMSHDFSIFPDIRKYVQTFIPDFSALKSVPINNFAQNRLMVTFSGLKRDIPFFQLSDGEKIFILQGLILSLSSRVPDMFVFWDEPDNYLARNEIQGFIRNLRSAFSKSGQLIITSHNDQAALAFSPESVLLINRPNHHSSTSAIPIPKNVDFPEFLAEFE